MSNDSSESFKPITDKASLGLDVNSDSNSLRDFGHQVGLISGHV